jgi:hypothetical protein
LSMKLNALSIETLSLSTLHHPGQGTSMRIETGGRQDRNHGRHGNSDGGIRMVDG